MATQSTATQTTRKAQPDMRSLLLPGVGQCDELAALRQFAIGLRSHQQGTFIALVNTAYLNESDLEKARVAGYEGLARRELAIRMAATYVPESSSLIERWLSAVLNHDMLNQLFVDGVTVGIEQGMQLVRDAAASDTPVFKRVQIDAFVAAAQDGSFPVAHNFGKTLVFLAFRDVLARQKKQGKSARIVDLSREDNLTAIDDMVKTIHGRMLDAWKARGKRIREAAVAFDATVERAYVLAVAAEGANALAAANPLGVALPTALMDAAVLIALSEQHTGRDSAGNPLNGNGTEAVPAELVVLAIGLPEAVAA